MHSKFESTVRLTRVLAAILVLVAALSGPVAADAGGGTDAVGGTDAGVDATEEDDCETDGWLADLFGGLACGGGFFQFDWL